MKAQQPHKNTVQLVALATTAAPSTWQNIMFWNINGAAKHLIMTWHNTPPAAGGVLGQAHRYRWGRWGRWSIRLHRWQVSVSSVTVIIYRQMTFSDPIHLACAYTSQNLL